MSGTEDQGVAAMIGAALVAIGGGIAKALRGRRGRRSTPPPALPPPAEPSATSARIGAAVQRIDQLEKEMTAMRHETAQKLTDLHESIDELKVANAATSAILPRVEKQLENLAEDLRAERRRPPTNRD